MPALEISPGPHPERRPRADFIRTAGARLFANGVTTEHALFFAYGTGANGKGVTINTAAGILKDYAHTANIETFTATHTDRHTTELAALRGARLVTVAETE